MTDVLNNEIQALKAQPSIKKGEVSVPKAVSKEVAIILKHLIEYGKISQYEARKLYNINGLVRYIFKLRCLDILISEDWELKPEYDPENDDSLFHKIYILKSMRGLKLDEEKNLVLPRD